MASMDEKRNGRNKITARGRITAYGQDEYGHRGFTLFIRRNGARRENNNQNTGRTGYRNGRMDNNGTYIRFAYAENISIPFDIALLSTVEVVGHIEGSIVKNHVWDKLSYIQYMVVDEVKKADTQLESAFPEECAGKGFAYPPSFLDVALKGEIINIEKSNHSTSDGTVTDRVWTRLRLKIDPVADMHRPSIVEMQYSSNMRVNDVECKVGDIVCVSAQVITRQKMLKTTQQLRTFEDIIVNDMVIVDRPHAELDDESIVEALKKDEQENLVSRETPLPEHKVKSFGGLTVEKKESEK